MLRLHRFGSWTRLFSVPAPLPEFNRNEENGIAHITSINVHSGDRSIVEISKKESKRIKRFRREFHLPEQAVVGLRQALIDSKHTPKQLQNEADQMKEKLEQRRFPAPPEIVKKFRDEIKKSLRKEQENEKVDDITGDQKIKQAQDYEIRNKVDKVLKKSRYNWKPLEFDTKETAAAYALARLAPNYAEIARCLEELPDFEPQTALDFGSGIGAGFWAVKERFPNVKEICLVDTSDNMTKMAMDIMRDESGQLIDSNVQFRRHLIPSLQTTYDLVIGHRIFSEIGSHDTRMQLIESLWARTNKYLLLIEGGKEDNFEALLDARDYLLISGSTVNKEAFLHMLEKNGLVSNTIIETLENRRLTDMEKLILLREIVPEDIKIPTLLPTATVFAPCPHDLGCPLRGQSSCSFEVRWKPIRADGKRESKQNDGTETGKFSFVVLEKGERLHGDHINRLLKIRKSSGHVTCDICTAFRGIHRLTVSKRHGQLYQAARSRRNGELFPLDMKTKATEGMFDLYEYGKSSVKS